MARQTTFPGFVGSAFGPQSRNVDCQDLINWYLEVSESPYAKKPTAQLPCPGFDAFCTLPKSPVRGAFAENDRAFAIGDDTLYEMSRSGVVTEHAMTVLSTPSAPTITPSPLAAALDVPAAPIVTHGGTLGSTIYGYRVTAVSRYGETTGSNEGRSSYGFATLSATNYNIITWSAVTGATQYKVYRTTGPDAGKLIGVTSQLFFQDIGSAGTAASPPGSNTSGGVVGSTTWGYKVVARLGIGHTAASAEGVTITGQTTLDADNYNIVTCPAVSNAHSYDVYRTTGTPTGGIAPPVLIGSTAEVTFNDTGMDGEAVTPPTGDTTGTFVLTNDGTPARIYSSGDAGNQLLIVSGGSAFVFDLTDGTLAKVVEGATSGGYIGGYFLVLDASTSTVKMSELLDGYSWDETQAYQRLLAGDRWLAMGVTLTEIWLFGSNTTDVWKLTGDNETRIAPFQDVQIEQGIIAPASLDFGIGQSFIWVGQNKKGGGIVWRSNLYQSPMQISTRGIEKELEGYSTLADAVAWSYEQEGHHFYVLNFPSDGRTWVYDDLTHEWHRRGFWDPNAGDYASYRPQCHAFAFGGVGFGLHLVGDSQSGRICSLNTSTQADIDGTSMIRRLRQAPHMSDNMLLSANWALVIDLEVGLGTLTGQGSNPTFMLQLSKDGGKTWGKELWRPSGARGKYKTRVKFGRLGMARDWVYRFVTTDPVPWRIAGAYFEPEQGNS